MNYFQCQLWKYRNRSIYPSSIIPRKGYRKEIDIDKLSKVQQLYILRRSAKSFDETFNKIGDLVTLREDAIEPMDVINMSLDLLGGPFLSKYLKFRPLMKTQAVQGWDGTSRIYLCENLNNYETVEVSCIIYFNLNKIHNRDLPYKRDLDSHFKKFLASYNREYDKKAKEFEALGKTKIKHDPTNLNYWHVEFKILQLGDESEDVPRKGSEWIKRIGRQTIKDMFATNVYDQIPNDIPPIKKEWYLKSRTQPLAF